MIDPSYYVPVMPGDLDDLDVYRANDIEANLLYLLRQWPAFEVETIRALIGDYGTIFEEETATPSDGVEVTLLQHLPRLLVLIGGSGLEHVSWAGEGWAAVPGDGLALMYALDEPAEQGANEALRQLTIGASWNADLAISLAAEAVDGSLRLLRPNLTKMLFRWENTWGRLGREHDDWGELMTDTWADARTIKKG